MSGLPRFTAQSEEPDTDWNPVHHYSCPQNSPWTTSINQRYYLGTCRLKLDQTFPKQKRFQVRTANHLAHTFAKFARARMPKLPLLMQSAPRLSLIPILSFVLCFLDLLSRLSFLALFLHLLSSLDIFKFISCTIAFILQRPKTKKRE